MDKSIQKYSSLDVMKAGKCRYWQGVPAHERIEAAWSISAELYRLKGASPDTQNLRSSFVRLALTATDAVGDIRAREQ